MTTTAKIRDPADAVRDADKASPRRPGRRAWFVGTVVLVVAIAAGVAADQTILPPRDGDGRRDLQQILDGLVDGPDAVAPGATAYVSGPGGTWIGSAGVADLDAGESMQPEARMQAWAGPLDRLSAARTMQNVRRQRRGRKALGDLSAQQWSGWHQPAFVFAVFDCIYAGFRPVVAGGSGAAPATMSCGRPLIHSVRSLLVWAIWRPAADTLASAEVTEAQLGSGRQYGGGASEGSPTMDVQDVIAQARDTLTVKRVFGEPYEKDGVTIIPAARVQGGAGGGSGEDPQGQGKGSGSGFVLTARPVGAFLVRDGELSWRPAVDVNRIILGGQVVAIVALLTIRMVIKARPAAKR